MTDLNLLNVLPASIFLVSGVVWPYRTRRSKSVVVNDLCINKTAVTNSTGTDLIFCGGRTAVGHSCRFNARSDVVGLVEPNSGFIVQWVEKWTGLNS